MSAQNKYLYPVTSETLHKYAEDIFAPIRRGECVTTVWVPMAGRRRHNKFIIENIHLFEKELPHYDKYLLVYIEPLDLTEESLAGYIRLMAESFIEVAKNNKYVKKDAVKKYEEVFYDEKATYSVLLANLRHLLKETTDSGLEIIFFLGEFDELTFANTIFYNNLKSLWSQLYPRLHYVFLMVQRVNRQQNIVLWDELNEAILQNVVHVPILKETDIEYMFGRLVGEFQIDNLTEAQNKAISSLCGGHPYMLKVAMRLLSSNKGLEVNEFKELLLRNYELKSVAQGMLDARSRNEKQVLVAVAKGKLNSIDDSEILDFLRQMRFVLKDDKGENLFGALFERAVLGIEIPETHSTDSESGLRVDENGVIRFNSHTIEEKFTHQEYSVLTELINKKGLLVSRDDIGTVLWGEDSSEKYSDWAIDQLISKLRKKLTDLDIKEKLVTIRGKGYKLK